MYELKGQGAVTMNASDGEDAEDEKSDDEDTNYESSADDYEKIHDANANEEDAYDLQVLYEFDVAMTKEDVDITSVHEPSPKN